MCSLLLDQGAEVDKETTKDYFTALMLATLAGISTFSNIIIVQYFVESNIISQLSSRFNRSTNIYKEILILLTITVMSLIVISENFQ